MTTTDTNIFDKVINSVHSLPKVSQDFIAHEIKRKIDILNTPILTQEQRSIVKERLLQSKKSVSSKQMHTLLNKYHI